MHRRKPVSPNRGENALTVVRVRQASIRFGTTQQRNRGNKTPMRPVRPTLMMLEQTPKEGTNTKNKLFSAS